MANQEQHAVQTKPATQKTELELPKTITTKAGKLLYDITCCQSGEDFQRVLVENELCKEVGIDVLAKSETGQYILKNFDSVLDSALGIFSYAAEFILGAKNSEEAKKNETQLNESEAIPSFTQILDAGLPNERSARETKDKEEKSTSHFLFYKQRKEKGEDNLPETEINREKFVTKILSPSFVNTAEISDLRLRLTTNELAHETINYVIKLLGQIEQNQKNGYPLLPPIERENLAKTA